MPVQFMILILLNMLAIFWVGSVMHNWSYDSKHFNKLYNSSSRAAHDAAKDFIQRRQTNMEASFVFLAIVGVIDLMVAMYYFIVWLA